MNFKINSHFYEFDPTIYPYRLWVAVGEDALSDIAVHLASNDCKRIDFDDLKDSTNRLDAFAMRVSASDCSRYGAVVFFRDTNIMTYGTVAHEAVHAAKYLFEHIGADISTHEPFEYVVEWIADCCESVKNDLTNKG